MTCYTKDELQSFLLEELSTESEPALAEHLGGCAVCRQMLDDLSDDDLLRDHHRAMLRDNSLAFETVTSQDPTADGRDGNGLLTLLGEHSVLPLQFGKFLLKRVLGAGGFATVYLADDTNLGREVAVKIPHLGRLSPDLRRRFLREGMAVAALHHPHIVPVLQAGDHRGLCFLVSEYVPGPTLRHYLVEHGACPPEMAARIVLSLADAIEHAHENNIVHRDVKPSNVLLDSRLEQKGLPFRPMLTDFGTARLLGTDHTATASDLLIGTAPYMAPEQAAGGEAGPACDIYALGALLFELIAGRAPIHGEGAADTLQQVLTAEPPSLHHVVPEAPRDLSAICARCLEKKPDRRYSSAADLSLDLNRFLRGEPTVARPLGASGRLLRWGRRNPLPLAIMSTITMMLMLIVGGLAWHTVTLRDFNEHLTMASGQAIEQRDRAEASEARVRQLLYASDLRLAERAWREGDLRAAHDLLQRHIPKPREADIRGIEWFFLERALHPQSETIAEVGSALYFVRPTPDSRRFVTAGADGVIRMYAVETGELLQSVSSGQGEVNNVAFSPDGQTYASAGDDGSICLWSTRDGERMRRIEAHDGLVFGVEFASEGRQLISCGTDARVHIWDVATGQRLETHEDHKTRIEAITISPDGRWLASVGKDRALVVRDLHTSQLHLRWGEAEGTLSAVAFSPDSTLVAVVQSAGEVKHLRVFDTASKALILTRPHPDGILAVAFSPSGEHVLTTDAAGTVRVWEMTGRRSGHPRMDDQPLEARQIQATRLYSARFVGHGDSIVAVGEDGSITRWNWRQSADEVIWEHRDRVGLQDVSFANNNRDVIVAHDKGIVTVNTQSAEDFAVRDGNQQLSVYQVATSPQGDWFVFAESTPFAASDAGLLAPAVIERWDGRQSRRVLFTTEANYTINDLCISPAGDLLSVSMTGGGLDDGPKRLLLLNSLTGDVVHTFAAAAGTKGRFTPDRRWLIFAVQRDIHVFDLESQDLRTIRDAHTNSQSKMAISGCGRWLATSDGEETKLWGLPSFETNAVIVGHQGGTTKLLFAPDGRTLLSSSHDGTVKAWSVTTGQLVMNLHVGEESVTEMALAPDGRRLALIEALRRLRVYDMNSRHY